MTRHYEFWPKNLAKSLPIPETTIYDNLEVTAKRYPDKAAIIYYGTEISYKQLYDEVIKLAGYMQKNLGVSKGDKVVLYMQSSPQYIISFYAILRADAIVVPMNPMNVKDEVAFYLTDSEAKVAIVAQELTEKIEPSIGTTPLEKIIVVAYSDYAQKGLDYTVPVVVSEEKRSVESPYLIEWEKVLRAASVPNSSVTQADDLCCMLYTSGTTGKPKGCLHTNKTMQANIFGGSAWGQVTASTVSLVTLPLFHVSGLLSMNVPIANGATAVVMTRWDRDTAGVLIERYRCSTWGNIATMVIDFLANPNLSTYNIESLQAIGGGGAALPKAIGEKLYNLTGLQYAEAYGLTETAAPILANPRDRAKLQCMGIPLFDVDARVINPDTMKELGPNEEGEVIVNGPQVFKGYWNRPEDTAGVFIDLDGKVFFRTGDIARYDEDGYFFMIDRIKRMINASGFNVWPAEVEAILYDHPSVENACVIGVSDQKRGETVKAFIVLKEQSKDSTTQEDIINWSKEQMSAYKYPRIIEFLDHLPISGSGKVLWRQLQDLEKQSQLNQ